MEDKFNCSECKRNFNSKDAFDMHNSAKHSSIKVENKSAKVNFRKIKNWGIFLGIVFLIFYGIFWAVNSSDISNIPVTEMNIVSHSNLAMHIHSQLNIIINDENIVIPTDIGVSPGVMRPVHTHDSTGEIHIEGPFRRDFKVGEFFDVWNRTFNSTCIFEYCTSPENNSTLTMTVNGIQSNEFDNYVMRDHDVITIRYSS